MATLLKLRLDEKTHKRIALFARQNKTSSSEVVRRAVESWACLHLPYEAVSDLIGVVRGGNPKRSEQTGRRSYQTLERDAGAVRDPRRWQDPHVLELFKDVSRVHSLMFVCGSRQYAREAYGKLFKVNSRILPTQHFQNDDGCLSDLGFAGFVESDEFARFLTLN